MKLRTRDLIQRYLFYFGVWEPVLSEYLVNIFNNTQQRTFVDIGSNIGYFSLLMASSNHSNNVVSIEAFPSIFEKLKFHIKLNNFKNIRAINCAVSNEVKELTFHMGKASNIGSTTAKPYKITKNLKKQAKVQTNTLINLLAKTEIESLRFIKIDAEGMEDEIILSLGELLRQAPKDLEIATELTPDKIGTKAVKTILDFMRENGFSAFFIPNYYEAKQYINGFKGINITPLENIPAQQTDVLFSRELK